MQDMLRQGFNALQAGEIDNAEECCKRVLGAKPDLPEGHFLVGLIALETKQSRTAISAFGSVTILNPRHGAAWAQLAKLYFSVGQTVMADEALASAVKFEDGDPIVHDLLGLIFSLQGDQQEAAKWFTKAASKAPDNPMFLVNHANSEMYLGHLDEAEKGLRKALEIEPESPNAHWVLAGLRKATDYKHVDTLRALLGGRSRPAQATAFLNYALGKELEDLEDWDEAFRAFARGAAARRTTFDFDEAGEEEMFAAAHTVFTADWLSSKAPGSDSSAPIFVVGQPRTGTTLIERVITSHSQVHSAGELRQFGNSVRRLTRYRGGGRFSEELLRRSSELDGAALGKAYLAATQNMRGNTPRFVDKLPPNYLYVPLILMALPHAKIVHVRRNPMDACFASFKQLFADAYKHSYEQREMARHHARYFHLMQHYREQFGGRYFEIAYEDAASNLEPNARALIEYLELPWEDDCLNFHAQKTAVTTASSVQVREPAHTRSIGRWRRYENHLQAMCEELQKQGVDLD
ncbi:MAG: tetratricopeptide repeat protein [Woeseiaceae bacterium]|nr:tetratricopeptide repeat protein [Woeseiaceae bacterium]